MVRKRGARRKRIKPRNPLAPVARRLRPKVKPSKRAYTRKGKHKPPPGEGDGNGEAR